MTGLRNATLADLAQALESQQARKLDMVVPASKLWAADGGLMVTGAEPQITADGVTPGDGYYLPTRDCDEGISARLGIPTGYLRRMRDTNIDLWNANVNSWLRHADYADSNFLLRTFRPQASPDGLVEPGEHTNIARALLSDSYRPIDHLDTFYAVLDAARNAGVGITPGGCDLTDRRFYLRLDAPEVRVYAPDLLKNYRDPRTGQTGADNPGISAGVLITNSETGYGSFQIAPYIKVLVCSNGMTVTRDIVKRQHLGAKLPEGIIKWSAETNDTALELIKGQARDAIRTFLNVDYMSKVVDGMRRDAGVEVKDPEQVVKTVTTRLRYSEQQRSDILADFIRGGDLTAFGVVQAVTSAAQRQDPDIRYDWESDAFQVLQLAAAAAR